MKEGW